MSLWSRSAGVCTRTLNNTGRQLRTPPLRQPDTQGPPDEGAGRARSDRPAEYGGGRPAQLPMRLRALGWAAATATATGIPTAPLAPPAATGTATATATGICAWAAAAGPPPGAAGDDQCGMGAEAEAAIGAAVMTLAIGALVGGEEPPR